MGRALLTLVLVAVAGNAIAAPDAPGAWVEPEADLRANTVMIEPLALILTRTVSLEYERAITEDFGVYLAPSLTVGSISSSDDEASDEASFLGVGAALGFRVYLTGAAPRGLFLGAFGQLAWAEATRGDASADGLGWAAGGLIGYTWVLAETFAVSLGAGAAYYDLTVQIDGDETGVIGLLPVARLAIGVAF